VSAISEQIADLEREIGGALLNRTSGRTRLTPHGQLFLAEARKTLLAADRTVEITNRSLLGQVGSLGIGFSCGVREVFLRASFATTANSTRHQTLPL
jgi:DNA-binding transcriptional LysR family regulator